jgi:hypothetical protein
MKVKTDTIRKTASRRKVSAIKKTTTQKKMIRKQKPARATKRVQNSSRKPSAKLAKTDQPTPTQKTTMDDWKERWDQRKAERAAMISADPENALTTARDRFDAGAELLFELVEKRTLYREYKNIPGLPDGTWDPAAECLASRFGTLSRHAAKYALAGHRDMIHAVWSAARLLTETIHDLAHDQNRARELTCITRRSLFLPSLRARPATFTHDFQVVADNLHLSEGCVCHMSDRAAYKLDSPITRLIAERVEIIGHFQDQVMLGHERYALTCSLLDDADYMKQATPDNINYLRSIAAMPVDEYLVKMAACRPEILHYAHLPDLTKATADEWWTKAVRQDITRHFKTLEGTRLYTLLKGYKPHQKLDDLRRRGKSALRSLARPTPQNPHPS